MHNACPHGFSDSSTCPECSKNMNVKPLNLLKMKNFVDMPTEIKTLGGKGENEVAPIQKSKKAPVDTLRVTRLLENKSLDIQIPSNSTHLHARLAGILEEKPGEIDIDFEDAVENRVREMRKSRLNPRVKES